MKDQWQQALGQMTYGIYVLTSGYKEAVNGMIASWVTQVSHDPPLILAAVHPDRYSHGLIEKGGCFGLHVLDRSQKEMLRRFKGPDPLAKFSGIEWETGITGVPILKSCTAWFELKVIKRLAPGNHTLFLGDVVNARVRDQGLPLSTIDYEGCYRGKH